MKFLDAVLFLIFLLVLLWSIKSDLFFMLFGTAVLLYFIIQLFFMDPLEILLSLVEFIFLNPLGFIILFIPLVISIIDYIRKKIKSKKNKKVLFCFI